MANQKVTDLTAKTTIADTDLLPIVDMSGTPTTKKITARNLFLGKGPSLFVASNSASASEKLIADYICDGVADQTEINAAIAALPATGGIVQLSAGDFVISGAINIDSYTLIRGAGRRATRIYKSASGFFALSFLGTSSDNIDKCGMEDLSVEGNSTTGGLLLLQFAQTCFFKNCSFDGSNDVAIDIITAQDSYFLQCTANTNHSATRPVVSIKGSGDGIQNSNMIWFTQCRIEDFWYGAVKIEQGSGYSGNNNGFYFSQCKFETTVAGGDIFVADENTLDLHLDSIFISATGFKSGYSTAVNAINSAAHGVASFKGIFFNASSTIGDSLLKVVASNGVCSIDNVLFDGTPVTSAINFNGSSGAYFFIGAISTGGGTLISGDATGVTRFRAPTQFNGNVGFYSTTPISRQVLATGTGKTVDNVITALQNLGLVSQS